MMQDQLDRSKAETEGILRMKEKVEGILEGLGQANLAESNDINMDGTNTTDKDVEKSIWDELEKEFS